MIIGHTRFRILSILHEREDSTILDLANGLGMTDNAIRQHMSVLMADRLMSEQRKRFAPHKASAVYTLTTRGDALYHVFSDEESVDELVGMEQRTPQA